MPLILSIVAVLNYRLTAAARVLEAIAPTDLLDRYAALASDLNSLKGSIASG